MDDATAASSESTNFVCTKGSKGPYERRDHDGASLTVCVRVFFWGGPFHIAPGRDHLGAWACGAWASGHVKWQPRCRVVEVLLKFDLGL